MTTKRTRFTLAATLALCLGNAALLSGCTLPNAGPLAGEVENTKGVDIVNVTAELSSKMLQDLQTDEQQKLSAALGALSTTGYHEESRLQPGDMVDIALWSFSDAGSMPQGALLAPGPKATELGQYQLDTSGTITLPYVGSVSLSGLTPKEARAVIAGKFRKLALVHQPDITLKMSDTQDGIIVTGSTGEPKVLPWAPGGMTLARAITLTLGNGASTLSENSALDNNNRNAITASIIRNGNEINLPISDALKRDIHLYPADKVIIKKEPAVQVSIVGGGIAKAGLYGFSKSPGLAAAIAGAQGLNPNAANSTRIFVFRQQRDQKPTLYVLSWKDGNGLLIAQQFPVQNGDIIYVAESAIVPVSRVLNTIFQMALPATIAR